MPNKIPQVVEILAQLIQRRDTSEINEYIASLVVKSGIDIELEFQPTANGESNLLISKGLAKTIVVAHTDVVPVELEQWEHDPFKIHVARGRLFGRGTVDNKTHVAILIHLALSDTLPCFAFAFTTGEETRLWGAQALHPASTVEQALVLEPTSNQIILKHRGIAEMEVTFPGTPGHSSLAKLAENSIYNASQWLSQIKVPSQVILNIGSIHAGTELNIIPGDCTVGLSYRYYHPSPDSWLQELIKKHPTLNAQLFFDFKPFTSTASNKFIGALRQAGATLDKTEVGFYSEAALLEAHDLPTILWGVGDIAQAHTTNEFISLKEMKRGYKVLQSFLQNVT